MEMGLVTSPEFKHTHRCSDCATPISPYSRGRCRPCSYVGLKRQVPEDFMTTLHKLGSLGCARFYHASAATVTRWRREARLPLHHRAKKPSPRALLQTRGFGERPLLVIREWSIAGQAADFLRHVGPIYRCNIDGKPLAKKVKGTHWNRNGFVLTDDDLIARAVRLGWAKPEF